MFKYSSFKNRIFVILLYSFIIGCDSKRDVKYIESNNDLSKIETESLLENTKLKNIYLTDQTVVDRIKAIETLARDIGVTEVSISFEWGKDKATVSKMSKIAPKLTYQDISIMDLLRYSTGKSSLYFKIEPGRVIILDSSSSPQQEQ